MTTSKQYLQAIKRLGLLFNKENQLTEIIGAKDLDKAENCDSKFSMLCHEVTKFSQEMGMEVNLRDLLDDYDLVEKIIKEVDNDNPNLLPKIQKEKGHKINEKTATEILDGVMYPKEFSSADNRLKYNTMQDIAQALKTGNGNDDECQDYEYRSLQRTVIIVLIIIGALPKKQNKEPKDIKADNEYAYQFFEKYILGKLPESNMNIRNFPALEVWKVMINNELKTEYTPKNPLYCFNRLNMILMAVHAIKWFWDIIIKPNKTIDIHNLCLDRSIPEEAIFYSPEKEDTIYGLWKLDSKQHQLVKFDISKENGFENKEVENRKNEMDNNIWELSTIKSLIKEFREIKYLKDKILITERTQKMTEKINKLTFEIKDKLTSLIEDINNNTKDIYEIIDNQANDFADITEKCNEAILYYQDYKTNLDECLNIKKVTVTRYYTVFHIGSADNKICTINKDNSCKSLKEFKPKTAVFSYSWHNGCLKMELTRTSDGENSIPEWLDIPSRGRLVEMKTNENKANYLGYILDCIDPEESNKLEWAKQIFCYEAKLITPKYIYCEIDDSNKYYRIQRENSSISPNMERIVPGDPIMIFSTNDEPDKIYLSISTIAIEMKDITGNPDFEIVESIEF